MIMIGEELQALRSIDSATKEIRERNAQRVAEMKEAMGSKFLLHPWNRVKKHKEKRVLK